MRYYVYNLELEYVQFTSAHPVYLLPHNFTHIIHLRMIKNYFYKSEGRGCKSGGGGD